MKPLYGVDRTPAGFVPYCTPCGHRGKPRSSEALAQFAVADHRLTLNHKSRARRAVSNHLDELARG